MKHLLLSALFIAFILPLKSLARSSGNTEADSIPLNQAAPDFRLKDMSGQYVSLSSLKGKVVILDFWATWCVPCHLNFPAMQKTVNHYKDDQDVVFLFIDTREKSANYEELAKADMKKNNYNFHVVFDELGADGQQNKYYNTLGMLGIPTQFIIDRKGIIRHKFVGYSPRLTDDEKNEELIKLIEKLKSAS